MSTRRIERVNEFIRREVCFLLQREVKDPRIGFITVLDCKVTPDLKEARVYVSVMGDKNKKAKAMLGLQSAAPYMQGVIGKNMKMRYIPKLMFVLDESMDKAAHIEELLKKIKNEEQA